MNKHDTVININAMLDKAEPPVTADCCIYKVPFAIRQHNDDAYTPKVISIGPFHHHHPRLQNMERHKLVIFNAFLQHTKATLELLIDYIDSIIPKFRPCYSETLEFTDQELVKLILIDSVFIIQLFWSSNYNREDPFLFVPHLRTTDVTVDLLLLENQLPFFVVEQIFKISFSADTNIPSFLQLTFDYFAYFNRSNLLYDNSNVCIRHFTDLIRIFHLQHPLERRSNRIHKSMEHCHSVTELLEAGVTFKPSTKSKCFLDLRFLGRVFEIPQLKVEDSTEILFRNIVALNIVALEQCLYPYESYITDYINVLNFLINTKKDVNILVQKDILVNWLGDNESVAKLFNSLGKNVTSFNSSHDYYVLCKNLDVFYKDLWQRWMANLRRHKLRNSGILLLGLSIVQTYFSVVQVVLQVLHK